MNSYALILTQNQLIVNKSPFERVAPVLHAAGFSPLPTHNKRPVIYKGIAQRDTDNFRRGEPLLVGLESWTEYAVGVPVYTLDCWNRMAAWVNKGHGVELGIGVCHTPEFVALDYDLQNPGLERELLEFLDSLPGQICRRRGSKGFAAYFRTAGDIESSSITLNGTGCIDILAAGRQSILPPSMHPNGKRYQWLPDSIPLQDVELCDLPLLTPAVLLRVREIVGTYGETDHQISFHSQSHASSEREHSGGGINRELNNRALWNLDGWFLSLGLPRSRNKTGGGFEAVPSWRQGGTGRPVEQRKRNLKADPAGIRDFGSGISYTPIDLVMAALSLEFGDAWSWLNDKVGVKYAPWEPSGRCK